MFFKMAANESRFDVLYFFCKTKRMEKNALIQSPKTLTNFDVKLFKGKSFSANSLLNAFYTVQNLTYN